MSLGYVQSKNIKKVKKGGEEMQYLDSWIDRFMAAKYQEGEEDEIQKPFIIYS
jgi:hypothetical protein